MISVTDLILLFPISNPRSQEISPVTGIAYTSLEPKVSPNTKEKTSAFELSTPHEYVCAPAMTVNCASPVEVLYAVNLIGLPEEAAWMSACSRS